MRSGHSSRVRIPKALLAVAALLAGCGGSDEPPRTQATETPTEAAPTPLATIDAEGDKRIVADVQLTVGDVPPGWQEIGDNRANRSRCPGPASARETATARDGSPPFTSSDETAAAKAFEDVSSDDTRQCLADELIRRIGGTNDGVEIGDPVPERVGATALGDDADAGRITIPISGDDGSQSEMIADLAFVRVGRGLVLMTYANLVEPLDESLRIDLTGKVVDRLTTELG